MPLFAAAVSNLLCLKDDSSSVRLNSRGCFMFSLCQWLVEWILGFDPDPVLEAWRAGQGADENDGDNASISSDPLMDGWMEWKPIEGETRFLKARQISTNNARDKAKRRAELKSVNFFVTLMSIEWKFLQRLSYEEAETSLDHALTSFSPVRTRAETVGAIHSARVDRFLHNRGEAFSR